MSSVNKAQQHGTKETSTSNIHSIIPPTSMVGVVEEQSVDSNMIHIMPEINSNTINTNVDPNTIDSSTTCENISGGSNSGIVSISDNSNLGNDNVNNISNNIISKPTLSVLSEDSINPLFRNEKMDLLHKKSIDQINDMKLKKATNPSLSSLRQVTSQNNFPTISSASTTLTKGSTRAEYFAAKLHDAIKSDPKIQNETVETFVYDTTHKTTSPLEQPADIQESVNHKATKDSDKFKSVDSTKLDFINAPGTTSTTTTTTTTLSNPNNNTNNKEKLQNIFNPSDSPTSYKTLEENFDTTSRVSSKKQSRRRSFKSLHTQSDINNGLQPLSKLENNNADNKSVNQLRQITSRLFDSKVVQPRRYSGIDSEFLNDSFDGDEEYYENGVFNNINNNNNNNNTNNNPNLIYHGSMNMGNMNYNNLKKNNNHRNINTSNNDQHYDYLLNEADYDDDELTSYFSPNSNNGNNNLNYLNKQQILGNMVNAIDYGSIQGDIKRPRKRNDFYNSPHDFTSVRAQRLKQIRSFCYTVSAIFLLLFLGFISGFILATNKELQNLKALEISNTIISQEELIFDMTFSAFNPGLMPISINNVKLDIFAKTQYLNSMEKEYDYEISKTYETVLLGAINKLEVPLYFQGGFLNRKKDVSNTEIKLINPCSYKDDDGNNDDNGGGDDDEDENNGRRGNYTGFDNSSILSMIPISHIPDPRWVNISRNPFDLIVRGAMMYKLPFSSQNHTISISYTSYIDPGYDY
ncbi:hypothetical protein C6P42_001129 [Pichia californica]|nr:hypothetical protein C6P42_001129 [[Candida] californica]